ncbi:MAG TPA: 8-amino-7-oxononanoate synthase [Gammaproteobacteria bacterium]|nr:8-amino-7-oxononanoate synthase [Gammaproteobacteria bacterium]
MSGSLNAFVRGKLSSLTRADRRRTLIETARMDAGRIRTPDGELLSFACNDYLGLSRHPEVVAAAMAATLRYGAGSGASRLISGNHPEYAALERRLADFKGTEDAVVFGSGYLANLGIVAGLMGRRDLVLLDELSHSCLLAGAQLAGSETLRFRHNDVAHCSELLQMHRDRYRHVLVATEGVFSMDGDRAPLADLAQICSAHDVWLLCDDAHGLGVLGSGRGSIAAAGIHAQVPLQMGTLSKALGGYGGFLCATRDVCDYLRNRARTFVYSTGLPPGVVAAAAKALEIIAGDADLVAAPLARARQFTTARQLAAARSAIVPVVVGAADAALAASRKLAAAGFFVPAIRPPTVPQGTARLRLAFSAVHTPADVAALAAAFSGIDDPQRPAQ